MRRHQRGGTILGLILGLLVGVGAALAVAVYVTNVPVPFVNKGNVRGEAKDKAEAERNKNWDPNSPLYGKNPARAPAPAVEAAAPLPITPAPAAPEVRAAASAAKTASAQQDAKPETKAETKPGADPLGDLAVAKAAAKGNLDPFDYFVQAGAFRTQADADAQRAKMAMLGWEARVSEREQNGRAVFRVRMGPFTKRDDAEQLKEKLDSAGVDTALVRVQR